MDHAVLSAALHPAFERFQRLWDDYAPLRRQGASAFERLHAVAACDVALLRVEGAEGLAPALPLASAEDLAALSSPDPVGFAGYPAEGMAVGGVNVRQPEPTVQVGHVTAVTDFFLGKEVGGGGQLIQHSLPLAGGASGSPVLDARGKVVGVISAANYAFTPFGERLPIAVGVNFAQRADLVRELLEGRAAEGLDERVARWQEDLQQFASGREIERRAFADAGRRVISDLLDQWLGGDGGRRAVELATPTAALGAPDASGRHTVRFTLRGLPAVPRLLVALPAVEADIDLYAFRGGTEEILGSDEQGDWYPAVALPPGAPADLDVTVVGPREGVDVTLHVFRAP